jgi:rhodanese-related sulfurtransferase
MTQNILFDWFRSVIKLHYPKLEVLIKSKKIKINEIPIITYCAHDKCNASQLALEELLKKGFVNVNEYSGGMKDYRNKSKI